MKNKIRKVLFITPPLDANYYIQGKNDSPPLGFLSLFNYLREKIKYTLEIDYIDGERKTLEEIIQVIELNNYGLVGFQPMMGSYKNSLYLAKKAKETGATVVFGGHHASQLSWQIIFNRKEYIDYVIDGDGEEAMLKILTCSEKESIPNAIYWDSVNKGIKENVKIKHPLNKSLILNIPDHFLAQYSEKEDELERAESKSLRIFSHKGCSNRLNSEYCYFCGRADKGLRFKSVNLYLKELIYLAEVQKADFIWEVGDDFLQHKKWLRELINLKKQRKIQLNSKFKIFARANRIDQEAIDLLKELNIIEVAIGFESGSDKILKYINKGIDVKQNLKAAELLYKNGVDTIASFVFGLPGETEETLKQTYDAAYEICSLSEKYLKKKPQQIIANLIEVTPGSPAFRELQKRSDKNYLSEDLFSIRGVQDDYFKMIYSIDSEKELYELRNKFKKYGDLINNMGYYSFPAGWND